MYLALSTAMPLRNCSGRHCGANEHVLRDLPEVILNEGDRLAFLKDRGDALIGQTRCPIRLEGPGM